MEKVKIKVAEDSKKTYGVNKRPIINIELEDGRKGTGFDLEFLNLVGKEIELDIRQGKEYNGVIPTYFNLPSANNGKNTSAKDWTLQKRITALECAARIHAGGVVDPAEIITTADDFYNWLNKK